MADKVAITFDEDNQIRVLEASKFREKLRVDISSHTEYTCA